MKLFQIKNQPDLTVRAVYRSNTWSGLLLLTVIMLIMTIFVALPKQTGMSWLIATVPATFTLLLAGLTLYHFWMYRKTENWLLKECDEGLLINLRSFKNYNLPVAGSTVLFFPESDIAAIGKTEELRQLPYQWTNEKFRFVYLEIYLKENISLNILEKALFDERRCCHENNLAGRAADCPVQISSTSSVRLAWDRINPGETKALDLLAGRFGLAPDRKIYSPVWDTLKDQEKEKLIDSLWENGHEERAYSLAAFHYRIRERQAKKLILERNINREYRPEQS